MEKRVESGVRQKSKSWPWWKQKGLPFAIKVIDFPQFLLYGFSEPLQCCGCCCCCSFFFHSCRTFHNVARFSAWNQRIIYSYMQSILLIHCVWEWGQIRVARVERKKKNHKKKFNGSRQYRSDNIFLYYSLYVWSLCVYKNISAQATLFHRTSVSQIIWEFMEPSWMMVFLFNKERKLVMLFFRFSFHYIPFFQAFRLLLTHLGTSFATRSSREQTSKRREKNGKKL